jgi:hypothetical protein
MFLYHASAMGFNKSVLCWPPSSCAIRDIVLMDYDALKEVRCLHANPELFTLKPAFFHTKPCLSHTVPCCRSVTPC